MSRLTNFSNVDGDTKLTHTHTYTNVTSLELEPRYSV